MLTNTQRFGLFSAMFIALVIVANLPRSGLQFAATTWLLFSTYMFVYVVYVAPRKRRWCVFDTNDPQQNQTIVEAVTPLEAIGIAGREVFDLDVEEAE